MHDTECISLFLLKYLLLSSFKDSDKYYNIINTVFLVNSIRTAYETKVQIRGNYNPILLEIVYCYLY